MPRTEPVAARVHKKVYSWIKEQADDRATTEGRIVEQLLKEAYQDRDSEESEESEESGESEESAEPSGDLPDPIYIPDSAEYDYALRVPESSSLRSDRKYYKTKEGVMKAYRAFYSDRA
jgi:hypothetical protein